MLKTWLTAKSKGATVKSPNKPTEGSGPRVRPSPFLSVEYVGSCVDQLDKATLADPKSCPNIGDHLIPTIAPAWSEGFRPVNPEEGVRSYRVKRTTQSEGFGPLVGA